MVEYFLADQIHKLLSKQPTSLSRRKDTLGQLDVRFDARLDVHFLRRTRLICNARVREQATYQSPEHNGDQSAGARPSNEIKDFTWLRRASVIDEIEEPS